jgi:hypothetical protein
VTDQMTVAELLSAAGLRPQGPLSWEALKTISERASGIYVVSLVRSPRQRCGKIDICKLTDEEQQHWVKGQTIIYIGRAKSLAKRLKEFHRHTYGHPAPHRGGQAVKLLSCQKWVFWATTPNFVADERRLINAFETRTGKLPFANRSRGTQVWIHYN